MANHVFGGAWTEIKLDAVEYYLRFYTSALKNKGFCLWYIDAFAGTGSRTVVTEKGGLLEGKPIEEVTELLAGSARRALAIEPAFQRFIFFEMAERRYQALKKLEQEHRSQLIKVHKGDANQLLEDMLTTAPWNVERPPNARNRGVLFLDPYAMTVPWSTLETVSKTKALDVWYLFPIGAVVRQLAHDLTKVDSAKNASLTRLFGTDGWKTDFYLTDEQDGLFGEPITKVRRSRDGQEIEQWFGARLRSLFPLVSEPIPILDQTGPQKFSLFFMMANDDPRATAAAKNCLKSMTKKFGLSAFHRRSDL